MKRNRAQVNLEATVKVWCKDICKEVIRNRRTDVSNGVRDYPGAAVVAADRQLSFSERGRSCKPQYKEYIGTPVLENKLKSLGGIGKVRVGCKNVIGACAEPHAARRVLNHFGNRISLNQVVFSTALRPRTMEKVDYCQNCKDTFPNL